MNRTFNVLILILILILFFTYSKEAQQINFTQEEKSIELNDTIVQIWSYTFQDPNYHHLSPHLYIHEKEKFYIFTQKNFVIFDRNSLIKLPEKSLHPSVNINYSLKDEDDWLWLVSNNNNPLRAMNSIEFFHLPTHQQKYQHDFFSGTSLQSERILALFQLSSGEMVISASNGIIYLYSPDSLTILADDYNLILLGVSDADEIILWDTDRKELFLTLADFPKIRDYRGIFNGPGPVNECYTLNNHLICFAGTDMALGLFIQSRADTTKTWHWHKGPPLNYLSYTEIPTHFYYSNYLNKFFTFNERGIHESELINKLYKEIQWRGFQNIYPFEESWVIPTHNGLSVILFWKKKICNVLNDEQTGEVSTRGLSFIGDDQLWVNSYSGFYQINIRNSSVPECSFTINKKPFRCAPSYSHNTLFSADSSVLIQFSESIVIHDIYSKECLILFPKEYGIDHIWDIKQLADSLFLIASSDGLFLSDLKNNVFKNVLLITESGYKELYYPPENPIIFRIKNGIEENIIFCGTSQGLLKLYIPENISLDNPGITLLDWKVPGKEIRDVYELEDESLLLATQHHGLLWVSAGPDHQIIGEFSRRSNAFISNTSHNILRDSLNRFWVSTNYGLYIIDIYKNIWRRLGEINGFPDNEFNFLSAAKSKSGLMAFGGINGVSLFNPLDFSIVCEKKSLIVSELISICKKGLKFSPLNFAEYPDLAFNAVLPKNTEEVLFRLKQEGNDNFLKFYIRPISEREWIPLSENYGISISSLKTGRNEYELMGQLDNGKLVLSKQKILLNYNKRWEIKEQPIILIFFLLISVWLFWKLIYQPLQHKKIQLIISGADREETKIELIQKTSNIQPLELKSFDLFSDHEHINSVKTLNRYLNSFSECEQLPKGIEESDLGFISSLITKIRKELGDEEFSMEKLATSMNVSYRQLHRLIKEKTRLSPIKFITLLKVIEGRKLLTFDRNKNIQEITFLLGYNKSSHFAALFKETYKISPKKYQIKVKELWEDAENSIEMSHKSSS